MTSEKTETLASLHKAAANGDVDACKGLVQLDRECLFVQNEEGLLPIHCAAEAGNVANVELFLDLGVSVDAKNKTGQRPLHFAASGGRLILCEALLQWGADIEARDEQGIRPLHMSARKGCINTTSLLLTRKAALNAEDDMGRRPLHLASFGGHTELCQLLLKNGADLKARDKIAQSALHCAVMNGHLHATKFLLDRGADICSENSEKAQAIHVACQQGSPDVIKLLLDSGASVSTEGECCRLPLHYAAQSGHLSACELLLEMGSNIEAEDEDKERPLHLAAANGHDSVCLSLVDHGADVNSLDEFGRSALHYVADDGSTSLGEVLLKRGANVAVKDSDGKDPLCSASAEGHTSFCNMILDFGADVENSSDEGRSALHFAAENGHNETCEFLLEEGANVNCSDEFGCIPLHLAAANGHIGTCEFLLSKGADIHAKGEFNWEVLHYASEEGHFGVSEILLNNGADLESQDVDGKRPLCVAAEYGHDSLCTLFIDRGADIEAPVSVGGRTAIFFAAEEGRCSTCELLLEKGANLKVKDLDGGTPFHLAVRKGQEDVCRLFLRHGANVNDPDGRGYRALHVGAQFEQVFVCKFLLDRKADVMAKGVDGEEALHLAAMRGNVALCQIFISKGASVNAEGEYHWSPLQYAADRGHLLASEFFLVNGADISHCDEDKSRALHLASKKGHTSVCKLLLDFGADISATDTIKWHALHYAAEGGFVSTCSLLLQRGADIECKTNILRTPLLLASRKGQTSVCRLLLQEGAEIRAKDKYDFRAVHLAAEGGHTSSCRILLKMNASVSDADIFGRQPLHLAAESGNVTLCKLLLQKGADCCAKDKSDRGVIHFAAQSGNVDACLLFLDKRAGGNSSDKRGIRPMHIAAKSGFGDICGLLLDSGADINATGKNRWHPIHYAASGGHVSTCKLLLERGATLMATDCDGRFPLLLAAMKGHAELCNFLVLDCNADIAAVDDLGRNSLHLASACGHVSVCRAVVAMDQRLIESKDKHGASCLHFAAGNGRTSVCKFLLDVGACLEEEDEDKLQAVHLAAKYGCSGTFLLLISFYADDRKDVFNRAFSECMEADEHRKECWAIALELLQNDRVSTSVVRKYAAPIFEQFNSVDEAVRLLDKYAEKEGMFRNCNVRKAFCSAVESGSPQTVQWLVRNGADVASNCEEALLAAAKSGKYDMIELIVNLGGNLQEAADFAKRQRYTNIAPVLSKSSSYPLEMFAQDERAREIYLRALAEGYAEALFIRLDIVGKDSSGKSSLRKSLTNQKFNPFEPSTIGVEFDKKCEIIVSKSCNWTKSLSEDDHLKTFEKILASDMAIRTRSEAMSVVEVETKAERKIKRKRKKDVFDVVEHKPAPKRGKTELTSSYLIHDDFDEKETASIQKTSSQLSCHRKVTTAELILEQSVSQEVKLAESAFDESWPGDVDAPVAPKSPVLVKSVTEMTSALESTDVQKEDPYGELSGQIKEHVRTYIGDSKLHSEIRSETYVDMLDYGGQDVFYATHYLFLSKEAIYFAVFDASIPLEEPARSEFRVAGSQPVPVDVAPGETYYDRLEEWISAAHLMQPPDSRTVYEDKKGELVCPVVFLVGTHKDKVSLEFLEKQNSYLLSRLRGKAFWGNIVPASQSRLFFAVDNTKSDPSRPGDEDEDVLRLRLKSELTAKRLSVASKIPIKFLRFERYIRKIKRDRPEKKTTSIRCLKLIASAVCDISDDEFDLVIRYLSNRAVILYHDIPGIEGDQNTILDLCWLTQVLQTLITVPAEHLIPPRFFNDVERSKKKGIVTRQWLMHQLRDVESRRLIVYLMEYFDLLCDYYGFDMQSKQSDDSTDFLQFPEAKVATVLDPSDFFIPCLLRDRVHLESQNVLSDLKTIPLHLYSIDHRVPSPLFYRLLTRLTRRFPRLPVLYRNVAYFHVYPGHRLEITLRQTDIQFCVMSARTRKLFCNVCSAVREHVVSEVLKSKQQGMPGLNLHLGFIQDGEFVSLEGYPMKTKQLYAKGKEIAFTPKLSEWFGDLYEQVPCVRNLNVSKPISNLIEPELHPAIAGTIRLLDVEDKLGDDWRSLGQKLLRRPLTNFDVFLQAAGGPTLFILRRWQQQEGSRATVGALIESLSAIYRNDVADIILKYLESCDTDEALEETSARKPNLYVHVGGNTAGRGGIVYDFRKINVSLN